MLELSVLLLIIVANSAPVFAHKLFGNWCSQPVDGGALFVDRKPWLGRSKTWRGLVSAFLLGMPLALWLPLGYWQAAGVIAAAMMGDLFSSFCKRRLGLAASSRAPLLDQLPEVLFPVLLGHELFGFSWVTVILLCTSFTFGNMLLSPWLYRVGIRRRPY